MTNTVYLKWFHLLMNQRIVNKRKKSSELKEIKNF